MATQVESAPPSLGDILQKQGVINRTQLQKAMELQKTNAHSLGRILVDTKMISEKALINALQLAYGLELINLKDAKIDPAVMELIPRPFAEGHHILPVRKEGKNTLVVAMQDPSDLVVIDAIKHQVKLEVKACIAPASEIRAILNPDSVKAAPPPKKKKRSFLFRLVRATAFPIFAFTPLPGFFAAIWFIDDFANWVRSSVPSEFDLMIYVGLGWGLWAILLFEINGLIFGRSLEEDREEE